jgi:serine/threonine protein phosphatase PrpC
MHTEQEQQLISSTIQKSFLKLDEQWINSIDPLTSKQSFVVHNGKWNSGACCLVNVVLQRIVSSEDDFCDGDDHDDGDGEDSVQFSDNDKRPKAILYSCHTGDCRAVLFSAQEESENDNRLTPSSQSDDDLFFQESDSDSDSDSDEENDHDAFVNGVTLSRKRMFLNPFQNHCSPPTKHRKIWGEHPIKVQENFHGEGTMTWASPDPSPPRARLLSASRSPSPVCNSTPFPSALRATTLTKDHTPYNQKEASLVRERCNYAPRAISTSTNGGIQRVAGSLSVTRALGDAYLKTPTLSFSPYKAHAPYISALPEVSARILSQQDRLLVLASDGVWERVDGEEIAQWMGDYFKRQVYGRPAVQSPLVTRPPTPCSVERNRSRRMRMLPTRKSLSVIEQEALYARILNMTHVSDMIVSKVLNKVRRKHKMPDIETLMSLPKGHSRRSKHDDITTLVIDLKGFSV